MPSNKSKHADVAPYLEVLQDLLNEVYAPDEMNPSNNEVSHLEKLERTENVLKGGNSKRK